MSVWRGAVKSYENRSVYLADGTKIEDPVDLLSVLPRWSRATRHIHAVTEHRRKMGFWFVGGGLGLALGVALGLNMIDHNSDGSQDWSRAKFPLIGGLIAISVGTLVAFHYRQLSFEETSAAYATYNEGLADALDVCVDHLVVVPCELLPDDAGTGPARGGLRRESKETYYPR